jgi:hypothetical protein
LVEIRAGAFLRGNGGSGAVYLAFSLEVGDVLIGHVNGAVGDGVDLGITGQGYEELVAHSQPLVVGFEPSQLAILRQLCMDGILVGDVEDANPVVVLEFHQKPFHKGVEVYAVFLGEPGDFLKGKAYEHELACPAFADPGESATLRAGHIDGGDELHLFQELGRHYCGGAAASHRVVKSIILKELSVESLGVLFAILIELL